MKIRRVEEKGKVEYPSFDAYQESRRHFFKTIVAGLGLAVLAGCTPEEKPIPLKSVVHQPPTPGNKPQILGKMAAPKAPKPQTPDNQPKLPGEMAAPKVPKKIPPIVKGRIRAPREPVALDGDIAIAAPPQKKE